MSIMDIQAMVAEKIEEIMAMMGNGKGSGKGNARPRTGPDGRAPQRPGRTAPAATTGRRCVNCGSAEHQSRDCNKAHVPREKRPCWRCGLPGHLGAQCTSGMKANLCDEEGFAQLFFLFKTLFN